MILVRHFKLGGDEFIAVVRTKDAGELKEAIKRRAAEWKGTGVDTLSLSIGYAALADDPGATLAALEKKADREMYRDKAEYYRNHPEKDQRKRGTQNPGN